VKRKTGGIEDDGTPRRAARSPTGECVETETKNRNLRPDEHEQRGGIRGGRTIGKANRGE